MLDLRTGVRTVITADGARPFFGPAGNAVVFVRDGRILRTPVAGNGVTSGRLESELGGLPLTSSSPE